MKDVKNTFKNKSINFISAKWAICIKIISVQLALGIICIILHCQTAPFLILYLYHNTISFNICLNLNNELDSDEFLFYFIM